MEIPFWEDSYKDNNIFTFGLEPNNTLLEIEPLISKSSNILDIGCGDGKNSLYFSSRGFTNVEAFDISENAINRLLSLKGKNKCEITAWIDDICKFQFNKNYDLIFSFGTLHFVTKDDWHRFILNAKEHTSVGGIHVMQLFTDSVPASADIAPFAIGLACDGEIRDLYKDWNIIKFKSYTFEDEHPNVPKHLHSSNKIVAQRIK